MWLKLIYSGKPAYDISLHLVRSFRDAPQLANAMCQRPCTFFTFFSGASLNS